MSFYGRLRPQNLTVDGVQKNITITRLLDVFKYDNSNYTQTYQYAIDTDYKHPYIYLYDSNTPSSQYALKTLKIRLSRRTNYNNTPYAEIDLTNSAYENLFNNNIRDPSSQISEPLIRIYLPTIATMVADGYLTSSQQNNADNNNCYYDLIVDLQKLQSYNIVNNVANTDLTETESGGILTIELKTQTEYVGFYNPPTATYTDNNNIEHTVTATIANVGERVTATWNLTNVNAANNVVLTGSLTRRVYCLAYLTRCTLSGINAREYNYIPNISTITATAENGYYFETAPTAEITNGNISTTITATVNNNVANFTVDWTQYADAEGIAITATAVEQPAPEHHFTNNIVNSTLQTSVTDNTVTSTIRANNINVRFSTAPTVQYYSGGVLQTAAMNVSTVDGYTVATLTFTADFDNVIFNGVLTQIIPINYNLSNATKTGENYVFITSNTVQITVTAENGYCFEINPTAEISGLMVLDSYNFDFVETEEPYFTANITLNLTDYDRATLDLIDITATAVPVVAYNYGAVNVYKVTKANLNEFARVRFNTLHGLVDLGNYVITLKRLYFKVGATIEDTIKCADYDTQIIAAVPVTDTKTINCGVLTVPQYAENASDYDNTEITIFLPFVGFSTLSTNYINKEISLQYVVSAVTGKGYAKLICENIVFSTYECDVSDNMMFEKINNNAQINQLQFNRYAGLKPYIIVKHFTDLTQQLYNNENKRITLNTLSGYARVTELTNFDVSEVSHETYNRIISVLNDGVIF